MAKDPSFPFYAQDYLVDTIRWSRAMQGLHISLMAESWANGPLVNDGGFPMGLGSTDVEIWLKIKSKWVLLENNWINPKLEEVRAARNVFRAKQSEKGLLSAERRRNGSTRVKKESQPKTNNGSTVVEPLESESEIESEIENIKGVDLEKQLISSMDELYIDQLRPKWGHIDFDLQYQTFCDKVRGSPEKYQDHGTEGLRLAFQHQLRNAKTKTHANGFTNKHNQHIRDLATSFVETYGPALTGGKD